MICSGYIFAVKRFEGFRVLISGLILFLSVACFGQQATYSGSFSGGVKYLEKTYQCKVFLSGVTLESVTIRGDHLEEALQSMLEGSDYGSVVLGSIAVIGDKQRIGDLSLNKTPPIPAARTNQFPTRTAGDSSSLRSGLIPVSFMFTDEDGVPIEGASMYIERIDQSYTTAGGAARAELQPGEYLIEVRQVGFEPLLFNLRVLDADVIEATLIKEIIELEGVVITSEGAEKNFLSPQSVISISPRQMKEIPVFLGEADVIKTVLTLPGVTTIGEGSSGFFVRGGNVDQNLVLQDGAIFNNPNHALGFFSVFNPDMIQQVSLYKSHIPAQFGGRLASALDVHVKDADNQQFKLSGGVGTVMSKLAGEVPLVKGKLSLLAGGRVSYSDWMLSFVKDPNVRSSSASFYDFNAKLSYRYGNGGLSMGYFQSFDRVQFQEEFGFDWLIQNLDIGWQHQISPRVSSEVTLVRGHTTNTNFDPSGVETFELQNGQNFDKAKALFVMELAPHRLITGMEYVGYSPNDELLANTITGNITDALELDQGREISGFIDDEWTVSDLLSLSVGLRFNDYTQTGPGYRLESGDSVFVAKGSVTTYQNWEPRISARFRTGETSSIKAGYNLLNQYIHLISNSTGSLPTDKWLVSSSWLRPQSSGNYSLGFFKNFDLNQWETSVEVFYRDMKDVVEYRDFADLVLNPAIVGELIQGDGEAYGAELFVKRNVGNVKGSLSYTYSRSFVEASINDAGDAVRFPSKIDRPHIINLILDFTITKRSKFGVAFNYTSGRPITAPIDSYSLGDIIVPHYSNRNQFRIPDYHRLDISYTFQRNAIKRKRYQDRLTIGIYNIYSRRNAFSVFFRNTGDSPAQAFRLSVLGSAFPSITYGFEF